MVEKETKEKKEEVKVEAGEPEESLAEREEEIKKEIEEEVERSGRAQAEKVLNDIFSTFRSRQEDFSKAITDYTSSIDKPLADVIETDDEIIVKTDLPGVKKDNIDVRLTEDSVEIKARFEEEYAEEDINYVRRERNYGESERFIKLPAKIKIKNSSAKFENAVLTIKLPKLEKEKFKVSIK